MSYLGRPNRVCDACHRMKAKCDKKSPSCSRCKSRGKPCVYSKSDPTFCSMNDWTEVNVQSRVAAKLALRSQEGTFPPELNDSIRVKAKSGPSSLTSIPTRLPLDWPSHAIGPFFQQFSIKPDMLQSTWGWLPELPKVYYSLLGTDSYLVDAVQACALANLANKSKIVRLETAAFNSYGRALRGLSAALRDPVSMSSDQTVYTVMLLQLFESISGMEPIRELFTVHFQGQAMIMRNRLSKNAESTPEPSSIAHMNRWLMWRDLAERNSPKLSLIDWPDGTYRTGLDEQSARYMVSVLKACGRIRDLQERMIDDSFDFGQFKDETLECMAITLDAEEEYDGIARYTPSHLRPASGIDFTDATFQAIPVNVPNAVLSNLESTMLGFSEAAKSWMRMQPEGKPPNVFLPRIDIYPSRPIALLWACVYIGRTHILRAMIDLHLLHPRNRSNDFLPPITEIRRRLCTTIIDICGLVPYLTSKPFRPNDLLIVAIMLHKICDIPGLNIAIVDWVIGIFEWIGTEGNLRMALRAKKHQERLMGRQKTVL